MMTCSWIVCVELSILRAPAAPNAPSKYVITHVMCVPYTLWQSAAFTGDLLLGLTGYQGGYL